jgi:hypothetical protein
MRQALHFMQLLLAAAHYYALFLVMVVTGVLVKA